MMSVNQMCIYHTLLESHNVIWNSSSENIKLKWEDKNENRYTLRSDSKNDQKVPNRPLKKCTGFTYNGSKLFNMLPCSVKETKNPNIFKFHIKAWIWKNIPSF